MNPEDIGYRAPITIGHAKTPDKDNDNFSTLEDVYKKFKADLTALEHVNAFDVLALEDEGEAAKNLLRQIYAKQEAYKILEPLVMQLESAVQDIKNKEEGK